MQTGWNIAISFGRPTKVLDDWGGRCGKNVTIFWEMFVIYATISSSSVTSYNETCSVQCFLLLMISKKHTMQLVMITIQMSYCPTFIPDVSLFTPDVQWWGMQQQNSGTTTIQLMIQFNRSSRAHDSRHNYHIFNSEFKAALWTERLH